MKAQILKPGASVMIGLALTIPTAYFILINILNGVGLTLLYNAAKPCLKN
jgi:hypothetical protein